MLREIIDFTKAVKLGEEVGNPLQWKKGQIKMNALTGLIYLGTQYLPPEYATIIGGPEVVDAISNAIVGAVLLVNMLLTVVHSKKLGL